MPQASKGGQPVAAFLFFLDAIASQLCLLLAQKLHRQLARDPAVGKSRGEVCVVMGFTRRMSAFTRSDRTKR